MKQIILTILATALILTGCSSSKPIVTNKTKSDTTKIGIAWNLINGNLDTAYVSNGSVVDIHGNFDQLTGTAYLNIQSVKDVTVQEVQLPQEERSVAEQVLNVLIIIVVFAIGIGTFGLIYTQKKREKVANEK